MAENVSPKQHWISMKIKNDQLLRDLKRLEAQMNAYKSSIKSIKMPKKDERITFKTRRGVTRIAESEKPLGRIIHKLVYGSMGVCYRYVVVTPETWVEIDDHGDIMGDGAGDVDPYGQVHWEENCPRLRQP